MLNNYSDSEQVSLEPHRRNVCICHKSPFDDAMTLTFDLENLFSNGYSHVDHVCQV